MKQLIRVMTHPFGTCGARPREILEGSGHEVRYNLYHRRLKAHEVADLAREAHGLVAGTEPYTREIIAQCCNLRVIARVGVGLDNVDLAACRERGIAVTYTPEAPADAVAELTVSHILNVLRHVSESDRSVRERTWNRYLGYLVREVKIGILGVGRIGGRVARLLRPFGAQLFGHDIRRNERLAAECNLTWMNKEDLLRTCDVVSVHLPLTDQTKHFMGPKEFAMMRPGSFLVNTARGAVVQEAALAEALISGHLAGAALDVFETEPYDGTLTQLYNVVFTAHMGASARQSRYTMELQAAEDCLRVLAGQEAVHPVSAAEITMLGLGTPH